MLDVAFLRTLIALTLEAAPFPDPEKAVPLLLGTAAQESGLRSWRQLSDGPARGLFQMEPATERDHWLWLHTRPELRAILESRAMVRGPDPVHLECNVLYQILLCRLHYFRRDPHPLPGADDLQGQAQLWKRCYNTLGGAGTTQQYVDTYLHLVMPGLGGVPRV